MSRAKWITATCIVLVFGVSVAFAASAHFLSCSASQQGNNLVGSFKIAGLGNETTCVTVSATATVTYGCFNKGGNHPEAANKETSSSPVTQSACFTPHNGSISGSVTVTPPGPGNFSCPSGQELRLISVTYSDVHFVDTTHNITCTP